MIQINGEETDHPVAIGNYTAGLKTGDYRPNISAKRHIWTDWFRREYGVDQVENIRYSQSSSIRGFDEVFIEMTNWEGLRKPRESSSERDINHTQIKIFQ